MNIYACRNNCSVKSDYVAPRCDQCGEWMLQYAEDSVENQQKITDEMKARQEAYRPDTRYY